MNATTPDLGLAKSSEGLFPVLFVAVLGLALVIFAGNVQSASLHDAAHDIRHATGFPCH
ncbi:MAG: CbtB domain-containing protein [Pseudomonadota bacterium]